MYNFLHIRNRKKQVNSFNKSDDRPVILLIKGLIRSHRGWMGLEDELSDKFDVICIDLPNVGLSKDEKPLYSAKEISKEMFRVLAPLNIKELYIMCTSFGTLMTLELTKMLTSQVVKGIILTSANHTGIGLNRISLRGFRALVKSYFYSKNENVEKFIELLIGKKSNGEEVEEEVIDRWKVTVRDDVHDLGYRGATVQSIAAGSYLTKDGFDYIKENLIPIKVVIPENDLFIPVSHQKDLYRYVENPVSECIFLKNAGHDIIPTHKKELLDIVHKLAFDEEFIELENIHIIENVSRRLKPEISHKTLMFKILLPLCFILTLTYLFTNKD